jgi:CRISPR type I-E-associated protein CasB/Cse2
MTSTIEIKLPPAQAFVGIVRGWEETHKGRLAILRRNAGEPLKDARRVTWIYDLLNSFGGVYGDEMLFLTAALIALDRPFLKKERSFTGSLGRTMALMKAAPGANVESLERRFAILLDADYDPRTGGGELPFRLRQTVKLIVSSGAGIDWPQLLSDLRFWNDPDKTVQKRWAKHFYAPALKTENTQTEERTETQGETDAD